jgi:hypothetical protein
MFTKHNRTRPLVLVAALAAVAALSLTGLVADATTYVAQFVYGVRYDKQASKPSNCAEGRVCDWVDTSGRKHFWNGTADTTTPNVAATAKGDIAAYTGTAWAKLAVGTNGQCLKADSTETTGLEWAACGGGGGGYDTIENNGTPLTQRSTLNCDGTLIVCSDDAGNSETDITLGSTVVTETSTDTLTNKTLTAPVLNGTATGTYTLGGTPTITNLNVSGTATANSIVSNVADGAAAVANRIGTSTAYTTAGDSILDLESNGTRNFRFTPNGSSYIFVGGSRPTITGDSSAAWLTLSNAAGAGFGYTNNYFAVNYTTAAEVGVGGATKAGWTADALTLSTAVKYKRTTVADTAYSVVASDHFIEYTSLTATRAVTLEAAATAGAGREIVVVDGAGAAAASNITFTVSGGGTLYGTSTISTNRGVRRLWCDGTAWYVTN